MQRDFEQLETEIDAQLSELADVLQPAPLSPEVLRRIKHALAAEALRQRRGGLRTVGTWAAAAAAILLAIGLRVPGAYSPAANQLPADAEPEILLDEWVDAGVESGERFTMLYNTEEWTSADDDLWDIDAGDFEDSLDSIDESFEAFEQVFGV